MRRIALILTGIIVGWALWSMGGRSTAAADAAAGAWLADEVRGTVLIRAGGEAPTSWRPLAAATPIAGQSEIATGSDGIAILHNGPDEIRMTPNSRLVLPPDRDEGLMTIIEQSLGKILFNIGSRPDRSFEVDSPYLVVLVKGTRFSVAATYLGDTVAVTEGTVEVRTNDGADSPGTLIGVGQTASVRAGGKSISVGSDTETDSSGGQGSGDGEPQLNLPQIRKAPAEPPGGGGGEEGEGSSGNGGGNGGNPGGGSGGSGAGGGGNPGGGSGGGSGTGGGGDPGAGGGGDPDPGEGSGSGGGHGCGDGHGDGHGGHGRHH